ncbi:zinc finger protein 235 [Ceratitis capitata]|uniref:(Mediterranean fruit fly) hypothetical protein n=1 Tax=Ceratitis capitata TaxID=7213 RepID=A0A811U8D7_CERCA|nr:zinc finger protein 235 [Ceratitis capitata]CAD6995532.1 unnamed protein product [Ceratitis capitata]
MKNNSDNEIEIAITQISTLERCCICSEVDTSLSVINESYLGSPPILLSDLLLQCFDSNTKYLEVLGEKDKINYICELCQNSLSEFYDALQKVSLKRLEFLNRVKENKTTNDAIEYFVTVGSADKGLDTSYELRTSNSDDQTCQEEFIKVNDLNEEYIELNSSEDEFVEVNQPDEVFDDSWSSDYSNASHDTDVNHRQKRKSLITIERMPEGKLRFCWRCDKNFPSDDAFEYHLKLDHTKNKKTIYSCHNCKQKFATQKKHNMHICSAHLSNKFCCKVCNAVFNLASDLKSHKKVHEGPSCEKDTKTISPHRNVQRQQMIHRLDEKHQCTECGNKYASKAFLEKHLLAHKDVRSFVCPVCDFTFRTAWNLKRHQKLHCLGSLNRNSDFFKST